MDRRKLGIVRQGVVVPYDSTELEEGAEVEIVFRSNQNPSDSKQPYETYHASHFSVQLIVAATTLACFVAVSPKLALLLLFVVQVSVSVLRASLVHGRIAPQAGSVGFSSGSSSC